MAHDNLVLIDTLIFNQFPLSFTTHFVTGTDRDIFIFFYFLHGWTDIALYCTSVADDQQSDRGADHCKLLFVFPPKSLTHRNQINPNSWLLSDKYRKGMEEVISRHFTPATSISAGWNSQNDMDI